MNYSVRIGARNRVVAIDKIAGSTSPRFRVSLEGRTHVVDAVRVGPSTLSIVFVETTFASCEAGIGSSAVPGELVVHLRERAVPVVVNGRAVGDAVPESAAGPPGEQRVIAPMPGRVLRVLVSPGDDVTARQPLVVVEAMKMENEMVAPKAGRVKEVAVREGMSVESGRLLVVVE